MQLILLGKGIGMAGRASGAVALIPETAIFAEWPALFPNMGGEGEGSRAQKEVILAVFRAGNCRLGFESTPHPPTQSPHSRVSSITLVKAPKENQPQHVLGSALTSQDGQNLKVKKSSHSRAWKG